MKYVRLLFTTLDRLGFYFLCGDSDTFRDSLTDYAKIYFLTLQNQKKLGQLF